MGYQLIIETSNRYLVVGIATKEKVIIKTQYEAWQKQSEFTMVEIENAIKAADISPKDLTRIIVSNGPGSFTGIRIGLTIAKVMASLLEIDLCVISSLASLAGVKGKKMAILDARSKRAYVGLYQDGEKLVEDQVMEIEKLKAEIVKNPDFQLVGDLNILGQKDSEIDYVGNLFSLSKITDNVKNIDLVTPQYLKG